MLKRLKDFGFYLSRVAAITCIIIAAATSALLFNKKNYYYFKLN